MKFETQTPSFRQAPSFTGWFPSGKLPLSLAGFFQANSLFHWLLSFRQTPSFRGHVSFTQTPSFSGHVSFRQTPSFRGHVSFRQTPSFSGHVSFTQTPSHTREQAQGTGKGTTGHKPPG